MCEAAHVAVYSSTRASTGGYLIASCFGFGPSGPLLAAASQDFVLELNRAVLEG